MRVTKTIREFIEKEVSNRLDAKYTAEKEEADFQTKVEQEVWEVATTRRVYARVLLHKFFVAFLCKLPA